MKKHFGFAALLILLVTVLVLLLPRQEKVMQVETQPTLGVHKLNISQLTATAVISFATNTQAALETIAAGGIPATVTPAPTLSEDEFNRRKTALMQQLESGFGFTHPVFEVMAEKIIIDENQLGVFTQLKDDTLLLSKAEFGDSTYLAGLISGYFGDYMLIFRQVDGKVSLVEVPPSLSQGDWLSFEWYNRLDWEKSIFADRNKNGLPDLVIHGILEGKSNPSVILEFTEDNKIRDISPDFGAMMAPFGYGMRDVAIAVADFDGDGIYEIQSHQYLFHPTANEANLTYWYGWDGTAYIDISRTLTSYYQPAIDEAQNLLQEDEFCLYLNTNVILQAVFNYYVLGQLEEIWSTLSREISMERCPSDQPKMYGEPVANFYYVVETLLNDSHLNQR